MAKVRFTKKKMSRPPPILRLPVATYESDLAAGLNPPPQQPQIVPNTTKSKEEVSLFL